MEGKVWGGGEGRVGKVEGSGGDGGVERDGKKEKGGK